MAKFRIITSSVVATEYIVIADNAKDAEDNFYQGIYESSKLADYHDFDIDSQEEILEINKI